MKTILLILLLVLNSTLSAKIRRPIKKKIVFKAVQYQGPCKSSKECVSVKADACGCRNGGSNRAILKKKLNAYEKNLRQYLLSTNKNNIVCLAVYMCAGEPNQVACVKGQCVLK